MSLKNFMVYEVVLHCLEKRILFKILVIFSILISLLIIWFCTFFQDNNPFSEAFQQREQIQRPMMPAGMPGPQGMVPGTMPPHPPGSMGAIGQQMPRPQGPPYQGMMGIQQQQLQQQQLPQEQIASSSGPLLGPGGTRGVPSSTGILTTTMSSGTDVIPASSGPAASNVMVTVGANVTTIASNISNKNTTNPALSKPGIQLTPTQSTNISSAPGVATSMGTSGIPPSALPASGSQGSMPAMSGLPITTGSVSSLQTGQTTITTTSSVQSGAPMPTPTTVVSSQSSPVTSMGQVTQQQMPMMVTSSGAAGSTQSLPTGPGVPQTGQHSTTPGQPGPVGRRGENFYAFQVVETLNI